MNAQKKKRIILLFVGLIISILAIWLIKDGLKDKVSAYKSPTDLKTSANKNNTSDSIRLGGFVYEGSLQARTDGGYEFIITDYNSDIVVHYDGILPDLFREGQGVYIDGILKDGVFKAEIVLAKHDATYTPPLPGGGLGGLVVVDEPSDNEGKL